MMNALIIVYMYICFILFYNYIPNVDGQPNPQQFSVLKEPIADVSDWTYGENENGPRYWPYLHPQYCSGQYQSPIAISTRKTIYNPRLTEFALFHDPPLPGSKFQVHNTGHTVEVNTVGQFFITNGGLGNIYKTAQFHFHWGKHSNRGSEHTIDGKRAPLEMHIVSWNQKYMNADDAAKYTDGLAVLSILFRLSTRDNPVLEPVIQVLPEVRDPDDHTLITIPATSIKHFLPKFPDRYFRYHGSLTTPNCNQAVIWSVFEQPQFISERQLNYFRQMLTSSTHLETKLQRQLDLATNGRVFSRRVRLIDNFRPIYELHGRHVYRSFKHFDVKPSLSKYYKEQSCFKPFDFKTGSKSYSMKPPNYLPILSKY